VLPWELPEIGRRMNRPPLLKFCLALMLIVPAYAWGPNYALAEGEWEITPESEAALRRGLKWLKENQGPEGNWTSNDLGLVGMGSLAFLSAGHMPGRGPYGKEAERAVDYMVRNAQPSGLLNISHQSRDMYNHGLSTFVLGQAYGMTGDRRVGQTLDRALKLIVQTQCDDGGWGYEAHAQPNGHDLSLAVMQAKALRSATDSGLEIPPEVIQLAIKDVRNHYRPKHGDISTEARQRSGPGSFTYSGGGGATVAMAAAGVVCMQEFGQYDDWRIPKNMEFIQAMVKEQAAKPPGSRTGNMPFDGYAMYYIGQAVYQVGGEHWRQMYPMLRDYLVASQTHDPSNPARDGMWQSGGHVNGKPGELYGTAVACFILAMPNRYLPILQEGKIERFRQATDQ